MKKNRTKDQKPSNPKAKLDSTKANTPPEGTDSTEEKKQPKRLWSLFKVNESWAIIIAAIIGLIALVLTNWNSVRYIFGPSNVSIPANKFLSGTVYKEQDIFDSFGNNSIGKVGDNNKDVPTKFIMFFNLGAYLDENDTIVDAEIEIPCSISGNPNGFRNLVIAFTMISEKNYKAEYFDSIDRYVYDDLDMRVDYAVEWNDTKQVVSDCRNGKPLKTTKYGLARTVENSIRQSGIAFVLFFDQDAIMANQTEDAIVISAQPILHIKYTSK